MSELKKHEAYWTCCGEPDEDGGDEDGDEIEYAYYFAPTGRQAAPFMKQRTVTAIIDIAQDGTLAGVELIDDMPPPPKPAAKTED